MRSIARFLVLTFALACAAAALADDVVVELGTDDDFVIEDDTSTERVRVEDAGEIHATGEVEVRGPVIVDPSGKSTLDDTTFPATLVLKQPSSQAPALIVEQEDTAGFPVACIGNVDSEDGFDGDLCGVAIMNNGTINTHKALAVNGARRWKLHANGTVVLDSAGSEGLPSTTMVTVAADVDAPAIYTRSSTGKNSTLMMFASDRSSGAKVVAVFDDDAEDDVNSEGFSLWFCDPTDLSDDAGGDRWDFTDAGENLAIGGAGTPFSGVVAGDRLAVTNASIAARSNANADFHEVVSVNNGGADVTLMSVTADESDRRLSIYKCSDRLYRHPAGGIVLQANHLTADPCGSLPEGHRFYNDTSDYYCFCDGAGGGVQMHDPATACF